MIDQSGFNGGDRLDQLAGMLRYPAITIHQLYVSQLISNPTNGPRNGLVIPRWLHQRAKLKDGEQSIVTREYCANRPVDALRNRTITPIFAGEDYSPVIALGPTATFLGGAGPSCCIVYVQYEPTQISAMIDLSFPFENAENKESDLRIRVSSEGQLMVLDDKLDENIGEGERDVLVASISGLIVETGEPYCNPLLAQIPTELMRRAALPIRSVEAFFSTPSYSVPALQSYLVPRDEVKVSMSGALFGAFPVGTEVVVDIYGKLRDGVESTPRFVHVGM